MITQAGDDLENQQKLLPEGSTGMSPFPWAHPQRNVEERMAVYTSHARYCSPCWVYLHV